MKTVNVDKLLELLTIFWRLTDKQMKCLITMLDHCRQCCRTAFWQYWIFVGFLNQRDGVSWFARYLICWMSQKQTFLYFDVPKILLHHSTYQYRNFSILPSPNRDTKQCDAICPSSLLSNAFTVNWRKKTPVLIYTAGYLLILTRLLKCSRPQLSSSWPPLISNLQTSFSTTSLLILIGPQMGWSSSALKRTGQPCDLRHIQ